MKKNCTYLWYSPFSMVLTRIISVTCLFAAMFCYQNASYYVACVPLLLIGCILLLFGIQIVAIDTMGITLYKLFSRKIVIQWEQISHSGMVIKTYWRYKWIYIYFAKHRLVNAPWERMPQVNNNFIYFPANKYLYKALKKHFKKSQLEHLMGKQYSKKHLNVLQMSLFYFLTLFLVFLALSKSTVWLVLILTTMFYLVNVQRYNAANNI